MAQFWVQKSAVGPKWSNYQSFGFKFGLYSLLLGISTWKTEKFHMGQIWATFGVLTLFGAPKLRGLITMEPDVHDVCNSAGLCGIPMFKMRQCENFQILSQTWSMGMGKFWVPKCAVGYKWYNFQPFRFKFGLCTWFLDICTGKIWETYLGTDLVPFWGSKIRRSHNYGTCASIYLKFGRFLFMHNDV